MATISSTGIGSGLDVNSIVSQLVALEKQPLKLLAVKATNVQSQISGFGQVQSQFAALTDVATRISDPAVWIARNASSSNPAAATIAVTSTANATSFSLDVDALAGTQSVASPGIATGTKPGAGTLTLQLGMWTAANPGGTSPTTTPTFGAGAAASVSLTVASTDTIAMIAANINKLNMGVVATAFNDGTNDRLLLSSKSTGAAAGFKVTSADAALSGLVFDPQNSPASGMSSVGIPVQYGQDAKARINGLAVTSATNTLANNIPGVTINLLATTTPTTSVSMAISEDVTPGVKNVSDFVSAYNTLNTTLNRSESVV